MRNHSWEDISDPRRLSKVWRCRHCGSEKERGAPRRTYSGNRLKHDWTTRDPNGRRAALMYCEFEERRRG